MTWHPDPVCAFHGRKQSEHRCLVCCLCFRDLTAAECHQQPDGAREDVCKKCAVKERAQGGMLCLCGHAGGFHGDPDPYGACFYGEDCRCPKYEPNA